MPGSLPEGSGAGGRQEVRVEVGTLADLAEVLGTLVAWGGGPDWPRAGWDGFVGVAAREGVGGVLLLARGRSGKLWGWLVASRVWERSELEYVLVEPGRRGRGVAGRLMEAWMAWARESGVQEVALEVREANAKALQLYARCGFVEVGRRKGYYREPAEDAVLMSRSI